MIKLTKKYAFISVILVMAILLSPSDSLIGLHQLTILWEKMMNVTPAQAQEMNQKTLQEAALTTNEPVFISFDETKEEIDGPIEIEYGELVEGEINSAVEVDAYTFNGSAGDEVRLSMSTEGEVDPRLRLNAPDGTLSCSDATSGPVLVLECLLSQTGTYSLLVEDWGADNTGDYELHLQCIGTPPGTTVPTVTASNPTTTPNNPWF